MDDKLTNEFILQLFHSCVINKNILDVTVQYVKENWLPEEKQRKYLDELTKLKEKGYKKIMWSAFELEFRKDKKLKEYAQEVQNYEEDYNEDLVIEKLERFIKNSKFIELYDDVYEIFNKGDKDKAYSLLTSKTEDLSNFTLASAEQLTSVFGDFNKRHTDRIFDKHSSKDEQWPFGIDELDRVTNGGPQPGDFVLYVGDAKSGKSILLIHNGINVARRGGGVLHFQLEGTEKQLLARYDSAWSGTTYYDVKSADIPDSKYLDHKKIVSKLGKNDIWIDCAERFNARTMVDIRRRVIEEKKTKNIKAVIIDYLDLANPDGNHYSSSDERFRQQKVSRMMKDLAVEQDVVVYSATQASSIPFELLNDPDFVITRENLAEDKGKVRPVDMLITINRTIDERRLKVCRLYCDALREHDSGQVIKIKQNLKMTRFYDRKATLNMIMDDE